MRHTARLLARPLAPDERERRSGTERSAIMRVHVGKRCPIMLARGELRHRDGLPRVLVEIMIDSPIDKFEDDLCKSLCRSGKVFV